MISTVVWESPTQISAVSQLVFCPAAIISFLFIFTIVKLFSDICPTRFCCFVCWFFFPFRFLSSYDVTCWIRYTCRLYPHLLDDKGSGFFFFCDKQWGLSKPHKAPAKDVCSAARTVVICRICSFSKLDRPGYCQITAIYFQMFLLSKKI